MNTAAVASLVAAGLAATGAVGAATPPQLLALAAAARIDGPIAHWCAVQAATVRAYALAVRTPAGGGRYVVLGWHDPTVDLGSFVGPPDLSCYTPAQARRLDKTIRASETVHGRIVPVGKSTVICGFVAQTSAVCWQYSAKARAFVKIGDWQT